MNILATMKVAKTLDYVNEPIQPKLKYFMKMLNSFPTKVNTRCQWIIENLDGPTCESKDEVHCFVN